MRVAMDSKRYYCNASVQSCTMVDMAPMVDTTHLEGLITFLSVARLGKYTAAAQTLDINHSTVSRRIRDLEKAIEGKVLEKGVRGWELTELGTRLIPTAERAEQVFLELKSIRDSDDSLRLSGVVRIAAPDAFTTYVAVPAISELQLREPRLRVEIVTATQQVRQRRSGVDIEIVIGEPKVNKAITREILTYRLRLYATAEYLQRMGTPESIDDLAHHRLNYYIESALQVDDLDLGGRKIPSYIPGISSTSVYAHLASTLSGAGIGLLPEYAATSSELIPVLPGQFMHEVSYWAVVREENVRNPSVRACLQVLNKESRAERFKFSAQNVPGHGED